MSSLYKSIYVPSHPRAFSNGCVYEHVLNAEEKIGRYLYDDEVVHHKDRDKSNNDPSNLIVFTSASAHLRFHNYDCNDDSLIQLEDGIPQRAQCPAFRSG